MVTLSTQSNKARVYKMLKLLHLGTVTNIKDEAKFKNHMLVGTERLQYLAVLLADKTMSTFLITLV